MTTRTPRFINGIRIIGDCVGFLSQKLTIIGARFRVNGDFHCVVACDCGNIVVMRHGNVVNTKCNVQSCGCVQKSTRRTCARTHGHSCHKNRSREYRAWTAMKERCYNTHADRYERYGGRGITVCERWMESFENFLEDVGPAPSSKHSIDRKEVDGNYEPGNCQWATPREQSLNKSNSVRAAVYGKTMPVLDWSAISGIIPQTIYYRLKKRWPDKLAVFAPNGTRPPRACLKTAGSAS